MYVDVVAKFVHICVVVIEFALNADKKKGSRQMTAEKCRKNLQAECYAHMKYRLWSEVHDAYRFKHGSC